MADSSHFSKLLTGLKANAPQLIAVNTGYRLVLSDALDPFLKLFTNKCFRCCTCCCVVAGRGRNLLVAVEPFYSLQSTCHFEIPPAQRANASSRQRIWGIQTGL